MAANKSLQAKSQRRDRVGQFADENKTRIPHTNRSPMPSREELDGMLEDSEQLVRCVAFAGDLDGLTHAAHDHGLLAAARYGSDQNNENTVRGMIHDEAMTAASTDPDLYVQLSEEFDDPKFAKRHPRLVDHYHSFIGYVSSSKAGLALQGRMEDMGLTDKPLADGGEAKDISERTGAALEHYRNCDGFAANGLVHESLYGSTPEDRQFEQADDDIIKVINSSRNIGRTTRKRIGDSAADIMNQYRQSNREKWDMDKTWDVYGHLAKDAPHLDDHEFSALRFQGQRVCLALASRSDLTPQQARMMTRGENYDIQARLLSNTHLSEAAWKAAESGCDKTKRNLDIMESNPTFPHRDALKRYREDKGI